MIQTLQDMPRFLQDVPPRLCAFNFMFSSLLTLLGGKPLTQTLSSGAKLRRPQPALPEPLRTDIMALNMGCQTSDYGKFLRDFHGISWDHQLQWGKTMKHLENQDKSIPVGIFNGLWHLGIGMISAWKPTTPPKMIHKSIQFLQQTCDLQC